MTPAARRSLLLAALALALGHLPQVSGSTKTLVRPRAQRVLAQPDWSYYHTSKQISSTVEELVQRTGKYMQLERMHEEESGYDVNLQVVTVRLPPEEEGLSEEEEKNKVRALLNFGQHGREHITVEVVLAFLQQLSEALLMKEPWVLELLRNATLKIIPMENVNGRAKVEGGDLCERKNGRGVDTNRNWEVDWGKKERDYDPYEEYPGKFPFSEPEAAIIKKVAEDFLPTIWINVHSGMHALFLPFDHRAEIPKVHNSEIMLDILNGIKEQHCPQRQVGSGGKTVGYLAHGTTTDYFHAKLGTPFTFTWEIYGDTRASYHDCFKMFNPITKEGYDKTVDSWTKALFYAITETINRKNDIVYIDPSTYSITEIDSTSPRSTPTITSAGALRGNLGSSSSQTRQSAPRAFQRIKPRSIEKAKQHQEGLMEHEVESFPRRSFGTIQKEADEELRKEEGENPPLMSSPSPIPAAKSSSLQAYANRPLLQKELVTKVDADVPSRIDNLGRAFSRSKHNQVNLLHPDNAHTFLHFGSLSVLLVLLFVLLGSWRLRRCFRMMGSKQARSV